MLLNNFRWKVTEENLTFQADFAANLLFSFCFLSFSLLFKAITGRSGKHKRTVVHCQTDKDQQLVAVRKVTWINDHNLICLYSALCSEKPIWPLPPNQRTCQKYLRLTLPGKTLNIILPAIGSWLGEGALGPSSGGRDHTGRYSRVEERRQISCALIEQSSPFIIEDQPEPNKASTARGRFNFNWVGWMCPHCMFISIEATFDFTFGKHAEFYIL